MGGLKGRYWSRIVCERMSNCRRRWRERGKAGDGLPLSRCLFPSVPVTRYEKTHPVPFVEEDLVKGTDTAPPTLDTPFGRVAAAICFDMVRS
jgi:hypothetical protein